MKDLFLEFKKLGSMTTAEVAKVIRRKESWVRDNSGDGKLIPRIPGYPIRFDPDVLIDVFCRPQVNRPSSLTIERHKTGAKPTGGYRKCL